MPCNADRQLIIQVKGLCKSYRMGQSVVEALRDANLSVGAGESVAIMGPSGSGKSTLLQLLGCMDSPTKGNYFLDGRDVSRLNDDALASVRASKIGFVFQAFNLIPQLTVLENVELPLSYQNGSGGNESKIRDALNKVGLSHRLHHHPAQLSGGEMQRVAIARALVTKPLLILADEPTGNLDSQTGDSILDIFKDLNSQGVTIIMVTHDAKVGQSCQRQVRMRDGCIVEDQGCK